MDSGTPTKYTLGLAQGLTQVLSDGTTTYLCGAGRIGQFDTAWTYPLGDALGSERQLSDAAGTVILGQNYAPYGEVISSFGTGASNFGYAGEWTDATGLQHLRARYMDPGTARFLTRDTWAGDYALSLWGGLHQPQKPQTAKPPNLKTSKHPNPQPPRPLCQSDQLDNLDFFNQSDQSDHSDPFNQSGQQKKTPGRCLF